MKTKYIYLCSKADHVHSSHLYWLCIENFGFEISEKIRFQFRASKISFHLWLLAYISYMVGFMGRNTTTFMFEFPFLWRDEEHTGGSARREVEDEVAFRKQFLIYIYALIIWPDKTITPMASARVLSHVLPKGRGFEPMWTPLLHFSILFYFF